MREKIFGDFQKYVKETFGRDIKRVEPDKAMTFKKLFGCSFIEGVTSMRICECGYAMIDGGYMYTCTKCGRSENTKGFRAWLILFLIGTYKVNKERRVEFEKSRKD